MYYISVGKTLATKFFKLKRVVTIRDGAKIFGSERAEYSSTSENYIDFFEYLADANVDYLILTGLCQDACRDIIEVVENKVKCILFDFCKISDVSYLSCCNSLKEVYVVGTHDLTSLWDMSLNPDIEKVSVSFSEKINSIDGIKNSNLIEFEFEGFGYKFFEKLDFDLKFDLSVLRTLPRLEKINLTLPAGDHSEEELCSLATLKSIKKLVISKHLFTFKEFAWLKSKLPDVEGLNCIVDIKKDRYKGEVCYLIIGSETDDWIYDDGNGLIDKYVAEYHRLVEAFSIK